MPATKTTTNARALTGRQGARTLGWRRTGSREREVAGGEERGVMAACQSALDLPQWARSPA
eukprot:3839205-Lingulodinium_polyedra.AAC.1